MLLPWSRRPRIQDKMQKVDSGRATPVIRVAVRVGDSGIHDFGGSVEDGVEVDGDVLPEAYGALTSSVFGRVHFSQQLIINFKTPTVYITYLTVGGSAPVPRPYSRDGEVF